MKKPVLELIIPINPATKKNQGQIWTNHKTGKPFIAPSLAYLKYEKSALKLITGKSQLGIDYPVNVKAVYYRKTQHIVDLPKG